MSRVSYRQEYGLYEKCPLNRPAAVCAATPLDVSNNSMQMLCLIIPSHTSCPEALILEHDKICNQFYGWV
jgi:hypothetical protein